MSVNRPLCPLGFSETVLAEAGGLLEYVARGFGDGHFTGTSAWLIYFVNAIVTAMVAVSFGSYASSAVAGENEAWAKVSVVLFERHGKVDSVKLINDRETGKRQGTRHEIRSKQ